MKRTSIVREEINFWPGYVDALINVVLNLLFLVGIFIVGLVALNSEAMVAQRKAAEYKLKLFLDGKNEGERISQVRSLLAALPPPPSPAPPRPTASPAPAPAPVVPALPATVPAIPPAEPLQALMPAPPPPVLPQAPPSPPAALVPSPPTVREIRIARTVRAAPAAPPSAERRPSAVTRTPEQLATQLAEGGQVVAQLRFAINQYQPPEGGGLDQAVAQHPGAIWHLVVLTDPDNERLSREAFTRLVAVRDQMLSLGVSSARIELRIAAAPDPSPELDRTVLLVARPR